MHDVHRVQITDAVNYLRKEVSCQRLLDSRVFNDKVKYLATCENTCV